MKQSCSAWVAKEAPLFAEDEKNLRALYVADGRYTCPVEASSAPWPVPMEHGCAYGVALVLQHWIEGRPDRNLVPVLQSGLQWDTARHYARRRLKACPSGAPTRAAARLQWCRRVLRTLGEPAVPGAVRYLFYELDPVGYAALFPDTPPWPAPAVKIVSFLLMPPGCAGIEEFPEGPILDIRHRTERLGGWGTHDLREKASSVEVRHEKLLGKLKMGSWLKSEKPKGRPSGARDRFDPLVDRYVAKEFGPEKFRKQGIALQEAMIGRRLVGLEIETLMAMLYMRASRERKKAR